MHPSSAACEMVVGQNLHFGAVRWLLLDGDPSAFLIQEGQRFGNGSSLANMNDFKSSRDVKLPQVLRKGDPPFLTGYPGRKATSLHI